MNDKNQLIIRRVTAVLTAISVIIAGICLISACLSIYFGEGEYTREAVSEAFAPISVAVLLCPALALLGLLEEIILPKHTQSDSKPNMLYTLQKRLAATKQPSAEILAERKKRRIAKAALAAILTICALIFFIYALNSDNYTSDINASVIGALYLLIPCLAVSFCAACTVLVFDEKSVKHEAELLKQAESKEGTDIKKAKKTSIVPALRFSVLLIALVLLIYGYILGGTADVLTKAVNICTECIGLG